MSTLRSDKGLLLPRFAHVGGHRATRGTTECHHHTNAVQDALLDKSDMRRLYDSLAQQRQSVGYGLYVHSTE
eukprot:2092974-Amphidinium_carterae.1